MFTTILPVYKLKSQSSLPGLGKLAALSLLFALYTSYLMGTNTTITIRLKPDFLLADRAWWLYTGLNFQFLV